MLLLFTWYNELNKGKKKLSFCFLMHQSIPAVPIPPPGNPRPFLMLSVPGVGHLRTSGWPPGIWHVISKPRRGLRCKLASPWRTREAGGCSWVFLKVYFLNFRYFFLSRDWKQSSRERGICPVPSSPPRGIYQRNANARGLARGGGGGGGGGMGTAGIDWCIKHAWNLKFEPKNSILLKICSTGDCKGAHFKKNGIQMSFFWQKMQCPERGVYVHVWLQSLLSCTC